MLGANYYWIVVDGIERAPADANQTSAVVMLSADHILGMSGLNCRQLHALGAEKSRLRKAAFGRSIAMPIILITSDAPPWWRFVQRFGQCVVRFFICLVDGTARSVEVAETIANNLSMENLPQMTA